MPIGLFSFNVYQDSINIGVMPYQGQDSSYSFSYIVDSLAPGIYIFNVAAFYDLSEYGFPGEFGESAWIADTVEVIWGMSLPFFESWDHGSFTYNDWSVSDTIGNWKINSMIGHPSPGVEFSWDPQLQGDYTSILTSSPLLADMLTEGGIFLDFDLRLDDRNNTGDEKMIVEVYDGSSWFEVTDFSNTGSFDFTENYIEITDIVLGNVFQIRFKATGKNSIDIVSWFIDNIKIYRECEPPHELTGDVDWNSFENPANKICWEGPFDPGPIAEWIYWDSGENHSGIAVSNEFTLATRWDAGQLSDYSLSTSILTQGPINENPVAANHPGIRSMKSFNIYRMEEGSDYELYDVVNYIFGQTSYCYFDTVPNVNLQNGCYYKVTANWESDIDNCESTPAMALENPTDDFVYIFLENIVDVVTDALINIYPNPAEDHVTVTSTFPLSFISITNYAGQEVFSSRMNEATSVVLNTRSFKTGVYIVKIKTGGSLVTKKIIITR